MSDTFSSSRHSYSYASICIFLIIVLTISPGNFLLAQDKQSDSLLLLPSDRERQEKSDILINSQSLLTDLAKPNSSESELLIPNEKPETIVPTNSPLQPFANGTFNGTSKISKTILPTTDGSGNLVYEYPFNIPPGRNGLQPDLKLIYNSGTIDQISSVAPGWSFSIPYIERINKQGSEKLYTRSDFSSSLSGELAQLDSTHFAARIERGDFMKYEFDAALQIWTAYDKKGTKYTFGGTPDARQTKPNDDTKVGRWYLTEIRDTNGNLITYTYHYPSRDNAIVPYFISYSSQGNSNYNFHIQFFRSFLSPSRVSYQYGFPVFTSDYITGFDVYSLNEGIHRYEFQIENDENGNPQISGIWDRYYDGTYTAPFKTLFTYTKNTVQTRSWEPMPTWHMPTDTNFQITTDYNYNDSDSGTKQVDVNGDGLLDLVSTTGAVKLWRNTGTSWEYEPNWQFPMRTNCQGQAVSILLDNKYEQWWFVEVNGDNRIDLVVDGELPCPNPNNPLLHIRGVYLNTGSGWSLSDTWTLPEDITLGISRLIPIERATTKLADVNGDGLSDIVVGDLGISTQPQTRKNQVWLNTGTHWHLSDWQLPMESSCFLGGEFSQVLVGFYGLSYGSTGLQLLDVNGDGLLDLVRVKGSTPCAISPPTDGGIGPAIWYNIGSGWSIRNPITGIFDSEEVGLSITDLNLDGLPDIAYSRRILNGSDYQFNQRFYTGTGTRWNLSANLWQFPMERAACNNTDYLATFQNEFKSWDDRDWSFIYKHTALSGLQLSDINGDGVPDIYRVNGEIPCPLRNTTTNPPSPTSLTRRSEAWLGKTIKSNLLSVITSPLGGESRIMYKNTGTEIDEAGNRAHPQLPSPLWVVGSITNTSSVGEIVSETETFEYQDGSIYASAPFEKKFAGFQQIVKTGSSGTKTVTYYHQGNGNDLSSNETSDSFYKIGLPYKSIIFTENSSKPVLYQQTITHYEESALAGVNRKFVRPKEVLIQIFDGNKTHKDKALSYRYDEQNGNEIEKIEWGQVIVNDDETFSDIGTDKSVLTTNYANNSAQYITGLPSQEILTDQNGSKVKETKYYYDDQPFGAVIKGNPTKQENWKEGNTYITTRKQYNHYGLVTEEWDGRGNRTHYNYDSFNLYPTNIIKAFGTEISQTTRFSYDYSSGQITQQIDPNGQTFETAYDGFDRVIEEKQPSLTTAGVLVSKTQTIYTDVPNNTSIKQINYLDATSMVDSYTYFDGFGHKIQERKRAEGINQYSVRDFRYNARGLLEKESLPYFSDGIVRTIPTANESLYTVTDYDALDRPHTITNSVGTTTTTYDDWKVTTIDALGNPKILVKDAFDRLIEVHEKNASEIYVTRYIYDTLGNLIEITDALGNIRNLTYDGLGRRKSAEDLHTPQDTTFGTWNFSYDDADNLIHRVNPNGQTVDFSYDALNRQKTEDFLDTPGADVIYTYDDCPNGRGKLCRDENQSITRNREYNAIGLVKNETSIILGTPYVTLSDFDYQGNLRLLTQPDGSQIKYDYNQAGLLEAVSTKEATQIGFISIIENFNYSPIESIAEMTNALGTKTTNTYDATELYRLKRKYTTTENNTRVIQDLNYTFDAVGNIKRITDNSDLNSRKIITYHYDDLYRLTNAYSSKATGGTNYRRQFSYDALGNLTYKSDQGNYHYNGNQGKNHANPHAVTSINQNGNVTDFTYDRNGNMQSVGNQTSYFWDYNNRLIATTVKSGTLSYGYDPEGQRIFYSTPNSITHFPTENYSFSTGNIVEKHIFAGNLLLATIKGTGQQAQLFYDHSDHLGGTNLVTNSIGNVIERIEYYPFGNIFFDNNPSQERRKYAGKEYDQESKLSYIVARYYNGGLGRFLSHDLVFLTIGDTKKFEQKLNKSQVYFLSNPQSLNSYSYANNNPIKAYDPNGNFAVLALPAVVIGVEQIVVITIVAVTAISAAAGPKILEYTKGGRFSSKSREVVREENRNKNNGKLNCDKCDVETVQQKGPNTKGQAVSKDRSEIDHIVSRKNGGSNDPQNGQNLCNPCNLKKGSKNDILTLINNQLFGQPQKNEKKKQQ